VSCLQNFERTLVEKTGSPAEWMAGLRTNVGVALARPRVGSNRPYHGIKKVRIRNLELQRIPASPIPNSNFTWRPTRCGRGPAGLISGAPRPAARRGLPCACGTRARALSHGCRGSARLLAIFRDARRGHVAVHDRLSRDVDLVARGHVAGSLRQDDHHFFAKT